MISDQGESPGEILTATAHFKVISLFCLHRTSDKIHPWKLFVHRKIFAPGKIKSGRKSLVKKKKNKEAQRRQKVYHSVKKGKHSLVLLNESDWYWQSSTLASRFPIKKSPSNQNLPYIMLKTRCSFLYASTSFDTKTLTIASNRNFKSCLSIRCLAPQHIMRFFHFCRGVLATLLIIVSSSSTLH